MANIFQTVLYQPLFNLLILIYNFLPNHDFGLSIVVLTVMVRLVLMPLSIKALVSQRNIAQIQPKLKALQAKYKNDRQALNNETMALYRQHGVNPLSGCLPLLIQIPILLALYRTFIAGFKAESLGLLYSFVHNPGVVKIIAFGLIDISKASPYLAIAAGLLQFLQSKMMVNLQQLPSGQGGSADALLNMNKQMLYILPAIIIIIAWRLPSGLTLYWVTTTIFSIFEQLYLRQKYKPNQ